LVNSADKEIFGPLATARVAGKPYTISEYNHPYPNQFSGEGLPMLAAFGRFQRWNGIFQYTYAHKVDTEPEKLTGYFDMNVHALQLVHSPACAAMFARGLVKPSPGGYAFSLSPDREIDILAQRLSPHALNFSGLGLPLSLDMSLGYATALKLVEEATPFNIMMPIVADYRSNSNQLRWDMRQKDAGYFTVNAPDVKVFTGFVRDREFEFGDVKLKPGKTVLDYATISLLSLEDSLAGVPAGGYLLTATGTMHNTNGEPKPRAELLVGVPTASPWEPDDAYTLANQWGDAPVLCEGIPLELTLPGGSWLVYPLDEAGNRRAGEPLRFENRPIQVGPECKTLWYEIRPL